MSLINDALKRAKQAQQETPPASPPLQFRPVEPAQTASSRAPLVLVGFVLALIIIVALGGLVIWFVSQKSADDLHVAARAVNPTASAVTVDSPVESALPSPPAPIIKAEPSLAPAPPTVPVETQTNAVAVVAISEPPVPPAPKLQGIAFHPPRPSAVVSGKTVMVGDRVGGFRVLAITRGSVTLGDATTTNVLSLSE